MIFNGQQDGSLVAAECQDRRAGLDSRTPKLPDRTAEGGTCSPSRLRSRSSMLRLRRHERRLERGPGPRVLGAERRREPDARPLRRLQREDGCARLALVGDAGSDPAAVHPHLAATRLESATGEPPRSGRFPRSTTRLGKVVLRHRKSCAGGRVRYLGKKLWTDTVMARSRLNGCEPEVVLPDRSSRRVGQRRSQSNRSMMRINPVDQRQAGCLWSRLEGKSGSYIFVLQRDQRGAAPELHGDSRGSRSRI